MELLLDIGNTSITYGMVKNGRLHRTGSVLHDNIPKFINKSVLSGVNGDINIVISSVVPKITHFIKKSLKAKKHAKLWVVGENLPIKIDHKYNNINKLGKDRLVNIYGALKLYKPPLLIIDYGTATTFDYVSPKGVFEGGMIVPGPQLSFQAVIQKAALLPHKMRLPLKTRGFLGQNTYDCLTSGTLMGFGSLTDELINRFKSRYGKNLKVIITGGFSKNLRPYTHSPHIYNPTLSLKALHTLHLNHK